MVNRAKGNGFGGGVVGNSVTGDMDGGLGRAVAIPDIGRIENCI